MGAQVYCLSYDVPIANEIPQPDIKSHTHCHIQASEVPCRTDRGFWARLWTVAVSPMGRLKKKLSGTSSCESYCREEPSRVGQTIAKHTFKLTPTSFTSFGAKRTFVSRYRRCYASPLTPWGPFREGRCLFQRSGWGLHAQLWRQKVWLQSAALLLRRHPPSPASSTVQGCLLA